MKTIRLYLFILLSCFFIKSYATSNDSIKLAQTLSELSSICQNVDFSDPKSFELGYFYKAAPFIVYRGDDENRKWKSACVYENPSEKEQVDATCERINQTINQDSTYKILEYTTETESEGTWHVLIVEYKRKGIIKNSAFAFLKINGKFLLGDID